MNIFGVLLGYGAQVDEGIIRNHEEAVMAWRSGKLPTADPPASPVYWVGNVA